MRYNTSICDIETDGLLSTLTKIHCIVIVDGETKAVYKYHNDETLTRNGDIFDGLDHLQRSATVVFHNGIGFDIPAIQKLYPGFQCQTVHDTFILSQLFYPNEMLKHGLEAWGKVFNLPKPPHEDWLNFSPEMLERCVVDTKLTFNLWRNCRRELASHDWDPAVALEYQVYTNYSKHMTHWYVDTDKLTQGINYLESEIERVSLELYDHAPLRVIRGKETKFRTKNGSISAKASKHFDDSFGGDFCPVQFEKLNLSSTKQVVEWFLSIGWVPDTFNYKLDERGKPLKINGSLEIVSPSLRNSAFRGIPEAIRIPLIHRNACKHRLGVLKGWQNSLFDGNKIETYSLTCACPSGRFKHRGVANVPKNEVFFGKEMRELFIAPEGYTLLGCDAAQIEARVDGHYTHRYDKGEYANFLLSCDVHQFNADSWGISRQAAKSPYYALSYQCGPQKIADLLNCPIEQANRIHKKYWDDRPALKQLVTDLERSVKARGMMKAEGKRHELDLAKRPWIKGLDGRKHYVRSVHSLKNTLIQGAATIIFKRAFVILCDLIRRLDARVVMLMHDEIILICRPQDAQTISRFCQQAFDEAGQYYHSKVAIVGDPKIGANWSETH